jgi:hypothetical protein
MQNSAPLPSKGNNAHHPREPEAPQLATSSLAEPVHAPATPAFSFFVGCRPPGRTSWRQVGAGTACGTSAPT